MDISLYLGRFFGLYLVIVGAALVVRRDLIAQVIHEFVHSKALILVTGIMSLILGLLFVLAHNIWAWDWPLLVTILAYLTLIKGISRLFFPEYCKKMTLKMEEGHGIRIAGFVSLILGIYLTICTFY